MGNIRRSRGYNWEYKIVNELNEAGWIARRLGGSSTGLPDIVAVHNKKNILFTMEAKSTTTNEVYVPQDQIERCLLITRMFEKYRKRRVIFAFKFSRKKRKEVNQYESRKQKFVIMMCNKPDQIKNLSGLKCHYEKGILYNIKEGVNDDKFRLKYKIYKSLNEIV